MTSIFTQNKNKEELIGLLDRFFEGYTITEADGRYRGADEKSLRIELFDPDHRAVEYVAKEIKRLNAQESVLVVHQPDTHQFM